MREIQHEQEEENEFRFVHLLFILGVLVFCLACWWAVIWLATGAWNLMAPYGQTLVNGIHP